MLWIVALMEAQRLHKEAQEWDLQYSVETHDVGGVNYDSFTCFIFSSARVAEAVPTLSCFS